MGQGTSVSDAQVWRHLQAHSGVWWSFLRRRPAGVHIHAPTAAGPLTRCLVNSGLETATLKLTKFYFYKRIPSLLGGDETFKRVRVTKTCPLLKTPMVSLNSAVIVFFLLVLFCFFQNLSASKAASSSGLQLRVCRTTQTTLEETSGRKRPEVNLLRGKP